MKQDSGSKTLSRRDAHRVVAIAESLPVSVAINLMKFSR